ncbi:MAG: hypothetical protein K2O91_13560 [Lachnospiraceae bacterium]|nr:hypothetical protein [Lachnospiraceae bacterium]
MPILKKKALKARIIDVFDNVLEEIFHGQGYGTDEKADCEMCCQLLEMISIETHKIKWDRNLLYTKIEKTLEEISHVSRDELILIYTPRQIVHDKFRNLKQLYNEKFKEYFPDIPTNF